MPNAQPSLALLNKQHFIDQCWAVLQEVERRHNEVVSTYRAHLLRAVQVSPTDLSTGVSLSGADTGFSEGGGG